MPYDTFYPYRRQKWSDDVGSRGGAEVGRGTATRVHRVPAVLGGLDQPGRPRGGVWRVGAAGVQGFDALSGARAGKHGV